MADVLRYPKPGWYLDGCESKSCGSFVLRSDGRMKPMIVGKVDLTRVVPRSAPMPSIVINARLQVGGDYPFRGGDLIEMDERGETTQRAVIKRKLSVEQDADIIRQYELTNLWVVLEKLHQRLIRYFDTGVNWDPHKEKVFPGITPPPQKKQTNVS